MKLATIRDVHGTVLANVVLDEHAEGPKLTVGRVAGGKKNLLSHYFGGNLRQVILEVGDFQFPATLSAAWKTTNWQWSLELRGLASESGAKASETDSDAGRLAG